MRIENWHSKLLAALDEQERIPHVWSESDCVYRCGHNAMAILAEPKRSQIAELLDRYRGRYHSLSGAYAVLKADRLTTLKLMKSLFEELPHHSDAEDGDIGAVKDGRNWSFGTFEGPHLYVTAPEGTGIMPRSAAQKVFRVD